MAGVINSLGMGSGVLTSDVIDKLKANDTKLIINPIDNKLTKNADKQKALDLLSSLATSFSSSVSSLQDSSLYQKRTVSGANDDVTVTADTGVALQKFSISDTKLATADVIQSGSFTSPDKNVATGSGHLNININGKNYKIAYDANTNYDDLKNKINDVAGSDVSASILQNNSTSYSLVVTSKNTGKDQQITMTDLSGNLNGTLKSDTLRSGPFKSNKSAIATTAGTLTLTAGGVDTTLKYTASTTLSQLVDMINNDPVAGASTHASMITNEDGTYSLVLTAKNEAQGQPIVICDQAGGTLSTNLVEGLKNDVGEAADIQTASDATFKYNGIMLTRPSNEIKDITVGVTINLLKDDAKATIDITQDAQPIKDAMQSLVDSYNTMTKQIDTMSLTDTEAGKVGLFNGDNSLKSIDRAIKRILTSSDSHGLSLTQYGLDVKKDGTISFDSSTFDKKMAEDPEMMANYFSGQTSFGPGGRSIVTKGVFSTLYDDLKNLVAKNGTLTTMTDGLTTEAKSLKEDKEKALASLKSKYDTMTNQFIAYDSIINKMNGKFSSLKQQIEMQINGK
ncbi:flagellar filament capping protein FliD [bacterium]|nr:flagellar filament capping protein FliD [bacterium]MBU1884230.1 flagellar filament capping protein FliD [bacterium]